MDINAVDLHQITGKVIGKCEFIYVITKDFCSNVNEPIIGETLFNG